MRRFDPILRYDPRTVALAIEVGVIATIAVSSTKRYFRFPEIPTFAELGVPEFEAVGWFGIVVPASTPVDVVARLNAAFVTGLKDSGTIERIRALGSEPCR